MCYLFTDFLCRLPQDVSLIGKLHYLRRISRRGVLFPRQSRKEMIILLHLSCLDFSSSLLLGHVSFCIYGVMFELLIVHSSCLVCQLINQNISEHFSSNNWTN